MDVWPPSRIPADRRLFAAVFLVAVLVRLLLFFYADAADNPSDYEYGRIARSITAGHGYAYMGLDGPMPTAEQAPVYPLVLAFLYWLAPGAGGWALALMVQILVAGLCCALLTRTAWRIAGPAAAGCAGAALTVYPPLVYFSVKLVPTTLIVFLLAWLVEALLTAREQGRPPIVLGPLLGLTALAEPVMIAFYPVALVWLWRGTASGTWRSIRRLVSVCVLCLLVIAPWTMWNYQTLGHFVPIKDAFGRTLWLGNNPNATGTPYLPAGVPVPDGEGGSVLGFAHLPEVRFMEDTLPSDLHARIKTTSNEAEQDRIYLGLALDYITNHPREVLLLDGRKFSYFWWFPPEELTPTEAATRYDLLKRATYAPVLLLGLAGLPIVWRRDRAATILFVLLGLSVSLVYSVTHVGLARYRTPLEPYLVVLAATTASCLTRRARSLWSPASRNVVSFGSNTMVEGT